MKQDPAARNARRTRAEQDPEVENGGRTSRHSGSVGAARCTTVAAVPTRRATLREELRKVRGHAAYARRLGPWLRNPLDLDTARSSVKADLGRREQALIRTLRDGVFAQRGSPY